MRFNFDENFFFSLNYFVIYKVKPYNTPKSNDISTQPHVKHLYCASESSDYI